MKFQMVLITEQHLNEENFECPYCREMSPLSSLRQPLAKQPRFDGIKTFCANCNMPYLCIEDKALPDRALRELQVKAPVIIETTTSFINAMAADIQ